MKPFDLERAKAGDPVMMKNGQPVRIICFDANNIYPIIGLATSKPGGNEAIYGYTFEGKYTNSISITEFDLVMATKKKKLWRRLWKDYAKCYHYFIWTEPDEWVKVPGDWIDEWTEFEV